MADRKIYVSKVSGLADYDGRQVPLVAGVTRVREGHPLLKGREDVFEEISVHYDIEDARSAPQDEPKPERVRRSTKQPESHQDTASHEGPASVGASHGGEASEDPPNQGPESDTDEDGSAQSTPKASQAVDDEDYLSAPAKPKTTPRRGPRKSSGTGN